MQRYFVEGYGEVQIPSGLDRDGALEYLRKTYPPVAQTSSQPQTSMPSEPQTSPPSEQEKLNWRGPGHTVLDSKAPGSTAFRRGLLQGGSLGFSDELAGLFGGQKEDVRERNREAEWGNPISYNAGQLAGGVGAGIAATLALPATAAGGAAGLAGMGLKALLPRLAALGAVEGAASSVGHGNADTPREAAKDAAAGGAIGGVLGGTLPAVGGGLRNFFRRYQTKNWANRKLRSAFDDAGPEGSQTNIKEKLQDPDTILADTTPDAQALLKQVSSEEGDTFSKATERLAKRQAGQLSRIEPKVQAGLGKTTVDEATSVINTARKGAAKAQYDIAYETDIPLTKELRRLLKDARYKRAFQKGFELVSKADDPKMYASYQNFKNALKEGRKGLDENNLAEFVKANKAGDFIKMMDLVNVRDIPTAVLDSMQRTLGKSVKGLFKSDPMEANIYAFKSKELRNFLSSKNPEFSKARTMWREIKLDEEALEFGAGAFGKSNPAFDAKFKAMNPSEQRHTRVGILESLSTKLSKVEDTKNVLPILTNAHSKKVLKTAFGSKKAYAEFEKSLREEVAKANTFKAVRPIRGSKPVSAGFNNLPWTTFLMKQAAGRIAASTAPAQFLPKKVRNELGKALLGRSPVASLKQKTGLDFLLRSLNAPAALDVSPNP